MKPEIAKKRGPGRPPNARRIWDQPAMKRRLIRLYLYTDESTLSTKKISGLISSLARTEHTVESSHVLAEYGLQTKPRSTQNELKSLFGSGYRNLRPRNREEARRRVARFRHVRYGRVHKNQRRRTKRPNKIIGNPHDVDTISSNASPSHKNGVNMEIHRHISLAWVREQLDNISRGNSCSSFASEIHTLLSRFSSLDSSLGSRSSSQWDKDDNSQNILSGDNWAEDSRTKTLIELCCKHHSGCLHRKFLMTASSAIPMELKNRGLGSEDFTQQGGRDLWNQTPFHLAARWAPDNTAIPLILKFFGQPNVKQLVNVKDVDGHTFMHLLGQRWSSIVMPPLMSFTLFCTIARDTGVLFHLRDYRCMSFFDYFLGSVSRSPEVIQEHQNNIHGVLRLGDLFETVTDLNPEIVNNLDLTSISAILAALSKSNRFRFSWSTLPTIPNIVEALQDCVLPMSILMYDLELIARTNGSNEEIYNKDGKTYVMVFIEAALKYEWEMSDVLKCLARMVGENVNLRDREGNTALHYAIRAQFGEVARILIASGIDVDARNLRNQSVQDLAILQYQQASRHNHLGCNSPERGELSYARAQSTLLPLFDILSTANREQTNKPQHFLETAENALALTDGRQNDPSHEHDRFLNRSRKTTRRSTWELKETVVEPFHVLDTRKIPHISEPLAQLNRAGKTTLGSIYKLKETVEEPFQVLDAREIPDISEAPPELQCPHCGFVPKGKAENHRAYFRKHLSTHVNFGFSCSYCTKTFRRQDNLTAHMARVHQIPIQRMRYARSGEVRSSGRLEQE